MIYTIGNIAVSGNTLTGTGTNFKAPLSMIRVGCTVIVKSDPIQIFSITEIVSETKLSVTPAASPDIPAGTAYSILLCDSISIDGLAQDVAEALRYFTEQESEIYAAVEYWKNYGDAAQVEALLTAIQAETAQSTANAQKTEADNKTTEGYKNAAATSATAAKSSQDAAKASETSASNSKTAAATSETNAAKSAADALNYRNHAQGIVGSSIGLGSSPRDCPDISENPSGYIGFMRIMEGATGFPSIASGEAYLTGFISGNDGSPSYTGIFQGWASRSLYTYRWSENTGPQWTCHARKDEVSRFVHSKSNRTAIYSSDDRSTCCYLQLDETGRWGYYSAADQEWKPLAIEQGGTGGGNAEQARHNLAVMHETKTTLGEIDLDTLTGEYSGIYWQSSSAGATDEKHYPTHVAGALVVLKSGANTAPGCTQIYYPYNNANVYYVRWCNGSDLAWSDWVAYASHPKTLDAIGLGASPRHCSDITGNPSGYVGFLRLTPAGTTGYPDVATEAGEGALSGYICCNDDEPSFSGLFVGATTGAAYTYRYSLGGGVQWQRIPRANDLSRFVQNDLTTRMYGPTDDRFFEIHTNGNWGVYSTADSAWIPLGIAQGGTGATDAATARTKLGLGTTNHVYHQNLTLASTSDVTDGWVVGGIHKSVLSGTDGTVRAEGFVYAECNASSPAQITFSIYSPSEGRKNLSFNTKGQVLAETAMFLATYNNPLIIESINPTLRFSEVGRPSGAPYYNFIADGGNWRIQREGTGHNGEYTISYEYATDRIVMPNLNVVGYIKCTSVSQSSDRDLKDNIEIIPDATAAIRKMNGYTYTMKENGLPYAGVIAQEVMEAIPEAVGSFTWKGKELEGPTQDGQKLREEARYLDVDYAAVTGLLVQVARETDDRVTALEEENASLRANIAVMDERITKLEALVQQLTGSEE